MERFDIEGREIGPGAPCFLIAEAGVNHNGNPALARELVDVAAEAGCDAVKFQTFRATELVTPDARQASYQERNTGNTGPQQSLLARLELSDETFRSLKTHCDERGIRFLSTPHTVRAAHFLEPLVAAFKVGSGDLNNRPFLRALARTGKPLLISTGMGTLEECRAALEAVRSEGNARCVFLHATTNYPCAPEEVNLDALLTLREELGCAVGYSDHTLGVQVSVMAATLGAVCLEKHFTLDRELEGPDHHASLSPEELRRWVAAIRRIPVIRGHGAKRPTAGEIEMRARIRKSLVAAVDIPAGAVIVPEMIVAKRPGTGLEPDRQDEIIGQRARVGIPRESLFSLDELELPGGEPGTPGHARIRSQEVR